MIKLDKKEDGLTYSYKYRLIYKERDVETDEVSDWILHNTHYDRQSIYVRSTEFIDNNYGMYAAVAVEVYEDGQWVVDMNWLEQYMDNNRRKITRI